MASTGQCLFCALLCRAGGEIFTETAGGFISLIADADGDKEGEVSDADVDVGKEAGASEGGRYYIHMLLLSFIFFRKSICLTINTINSVCVYLNQDTSGAKDEEAGGDKNSEAGEGGTKSEEPKAKASASADKKKKKKKKAKGKK